MRKFTLLSVLLAFICFSGAIAQKYDHPLIGRYGDSWIHHQEISNLNEYTIALQGIVDKNISETKKLEGKVTMTLYRLEGASSFEIYMAYKELLISKNFEILFACEKTDCGENFLEVFYSLAPFTSDYGWNNSVPITRGKREFSYVLTARRESGETAIYVSLIVSQGWFNEPIYKLDVIDVVRSAKGIASITGPAKEEEKRIDEYEMSKSNEKKGFKSFDVKFGYGAYSFSDPNFAGTSYNFTDNQTGVTTGLLSGFKDLSGPYFNSRYFFNENFGISLDVNLLMSSQFIGTDATNYNSSANLVMEKIGFTGQIIGKTTPVKLSLTLGAGTCQGEFYESWSSNTAPEGQYLKGKNTMFLVFYNTEVSFSVFKNINFFGQYEYNFMHSVLVMNHDGGNEYTKTYWSANFGGSHFRLGIGVSF